MDRRLPHPWDASYPPSLWTPPPSDAPAGVQPGQPGSFTPPGADVPADLAALNALGPLGQSAAWSADAYVELGDGSSATWDGAAWVAYTPAPPPPADTPDDGWTVAEIRAWIDANAGTANSNLTKAELLDLVADMLDTD